MTSDPQNEISQFSFLFESACFRAGISNLSQVAGKFTSKKIAGLTLLKNTFAGHSCFKIVVVIIIKILFQIIKISNVILKRY